MILNLSLFCSVTLYIVCVVWYILYCATMFRIGVLVVGSRIISNLFIPDWYSDSIVTSSM